MPAFRKGKFMKKVDLNHGWRLRGTGMSVKSPEELSIKEGCWYECDVPCDVRMPLIAAGVIKDPVLAGYSYESEWIEDRAWWYFKGFEYKDENYGAAELFMGSIDTDAEIYLNGIHIGSHRNAHRAFIKDVKEFLVSGMNTLAVRVTTGLEKINSEDFGEIDRACCSECDGNVYDKHRGDYRRAFVRRPQYTIGWDWGPRVVTCGIVGDVELRCFKKIAVRELRLTTGRDCSKIAVAANIEVLDCFATMECGFGFTMDFGGATEVSVKEEKVFLTSGYNYIDFEVEVEEPKLWWPNGYGEQNLYTVNFNVACGGEVISYPAFSYGIRHIEMDLSPITGEERYFALKVNGVRIFCKGGDWIPADSIYARVSDAKYEALIGEAAQANFNALRVWGGGIYEKEIFYDLCDRYGILLWHDFMFACSTYPDHIDGFREECRREIDYQTKRLRNRACIGLFCGNNENHEIFYARGDENHWNLNYTRNKQYGLYISNVVAKEVLRNNCPGIPYWPSSPYGGERPTSEMVGDVHHWGAAMMNPNMENRIDPFVYDRLDAKFVSEYGYIGPCPIESIETYFDGQEVDRNSPIWKLHNNNFEKETVLAGISKHYIAGAGALSLEDYLRYAGAVHSLILGYSLEAIRFKEHCHGAIFWMYNDTWGEVGWTIIDYYLRRKTAYYGVKRAFRTKKLSLRAVDGTVTLQACNDTPENIKVKAKAGYISLDGKIRELEDIEISAGPRSREYVYSRSLPDRDYTFGLFAVIPEGVFEPVALYTGDYSELHTVKSDIEMVCREEDGGVAVTLKSPVYTHFVCIEGGFKCSDNYFDLLPGEEKTIVVFGAKPEDIRVTSLN